jgi:hypothetical protein
MEKVKGWIKIDYHPNDNIVELIKQLRKTYNVIYNKSGTLYIKKYETNSRKN